MDLANFCQFSEFFAQRTLVNDAFIIAGCTQSRCSYYGPRVVFVENCDEDGDTETIACRLRACYSFSVIVSLTRYFEGNCWVSNVGLSVRLKQNCGEILSFFLGFGCFRFFFVFTDRSS